MALHVTCVITRPPAIERLSAGATRPHSAPHSEVVGRRPLSAPSAASHSALEHAPAPVSALDSRLVPAADKASRCAAAQNRGGRQRDERNVCSVCSGSRGTSGSRGWCSSSRAATDGLESGRLWANKPPTMAPNGVLTLLKMALMVLKILSNF